MTKEAFAEVKKKYDDAIKTGNVWRLPSGAILEVMRDIAMKTPFEQ